MRCLLTGLLLLPLTLFAQKKPLDHTVYDSWQSIGERLISNDGKWVVYTVTPQEGDADLFVRSSDGSYNQQIQRGYNALITEDNRFLVFRIRPTYKETREARIRKKRPDEMPKDSIGIVELGKANLMKVAKVRSYKTPEKGIGWVAYHKERDPLSPRAAALPTQKTVDSLRRTIDSLSLLVTQLKNTRAGNRDGLDADEEPAATASANEGSDLVLRNLAGGKDRIFRNVVDYAFSMYGQKLVFRTARSARDSGSVNAVLLLDLASNKLDTVLKNGNDFRAFTFTEDGGRLAFLAERDTNSKAPVKHYGLYLYRNGDDSAVLLVNKGTPGMKLGMTVSENGQLTFSKSGRRLFFGTAPLPSMKDTSLVDIDLVKLDIWNYKDDYLQTQQLFQLNTELRRTYLTQFDFDSGRLLQLASPDLPNVVTMNEGDAEFYVAVTDTGRRVESQWSGSTKKDIYALNARTGALTLVKKNHTGNIYPSSTGRYILLYDTKQRNYFLWDGKGLRNVTAGVREPLYDVENDVPNDPGPYGIMGWHQNDSVLYVNGQHNVWAIDPSGKKNPHPLFTAPPKSLVTYRYLRVNNDERFLGSGQDAYFRMFDDRSKNSGLVHIQFPSAAGPMPVLTDLVSAYGPYAYNSFARARKTPAYIYTRETYQAAPDLFSADERTQNSREPGWNTSGLNAVRLSTINPQQASYNWGTAELFNWKTFDGKSSAGILYKPENFDSTKKYPMIVYFYETVTDGLHNYIAPAPTPSRLNIPFFVSRGYLVFTPDIHYTKGHPGKDAYNYIVSGSQALAKKPWVDGRNIGIQGQSWGGYQVAWLITATDMFKAAWAGAPVVNMFSAYGGIRWESGNNRQFQYEKGQSRIGATPWERPDLYMENSPFFHLQKVKTPLVIMSNDADGAVPWYQGIEFFTAMRRLNKKVWLLNYNGEAHNLIERRNRKDIQVREQQFFDWMLKGEKPAKWLDEGVPATRKGKDWGLELVDGN